MKGFLFLFCLFCGTATFGQTTGYTRNTEPTIPQSPSHPAHASYSTMTAEMSVLGGVNYSMAQGDRRASDFPQAEDVSLGIVARKLKEEHIQDKKSTVIWVNQ